MHSVPLTDRLSAATQPDRDDFARLAEEGVTTVINNRPDGEEPGQLTAAEGAAVAAQAGLAYHHLPVGGAHPLTRDVVERFGAIVDEADGAVLAHCRSGTRSTTLWVLREVLAGRMSREEVVPFGRERGLDLRGALA
jgi:uncharacterized protein (TIGR01244 family)